MFLTKLLQVSSGRPDCCTVGINRGIINIYTNFYAVNDQPEIIVNWV